MYIPPIRVSIYLEHSLLLLFVKERVIVLVVGPVGFVVSGCH